MHPPGRLRDHDPRDPRARLERRTSRLSALIATCAALGCQPSTPSDPPQDGGERRGDAATFDAGPAGDAAAVDAGPAGDAATFDAGGLEDAGSADASVSSDAAVSEDGGDAADAGPPSDWRWVPVEGTRCGNGTPAGFGVRAGRAGDRRVALFVMGGGACFDAATCFGPAVLRAVHVDDMWPYSEATLRADLAPVLASGLMDREPDSVFRDATMVFVPYCTGDLHAGHRTATYEVFGIPRTVHHVGADNMQAILATLATQLPDTERIFAVGFSAGGYGALFNAPAIRDAFPASRLDVISDGGILITPAGGRAAVFARTWDMRFPVDCPTCETRWEDYAGWLTTRLGPAGRHGLVTFSNDAVIGAFFAFPAVDVRAPIAALLTAGYTASPRAAAFVLPGTGHVALDRYRTIAASDGTRIEGWVRAWAGDDASWATVNP